jgi:hypothetical protein
MRDGILDVPQVIAAQTFLSKESQGPALMQLLDELL